jgi:SAM-dependent methyltransferase
MPGEKIVDVGCGCGDTSIALAKAVGPAGRVLGVDVSEPMLAVARRRSAHAGLANLAFRRADAASAALPAEHDLIFSRFGVMFFDDPAAAFANMRRWLAPSGRIAFCCWRPPRENPWGIIPVAAVREALGLEAPPMDPTAPGPFAFADADRLRGIMERAGFSDFDAARYDAQVPMGETLEAAGEQMLRYGPAARAVRGVSEADRRTASAAIAKALAPYAAPDGSVSAPGSVWIVTARAD